MWNKQEEDKFQALLKKYSETPAAEDNAEDKALVDSLVNVYIQTGNINFYLKIAQLLDIFLKAALKGKTLDLNTLSEVQKNGLNLDKQFPFFFNISKKIQEISREMRANMDAKHKVYSEKADLKGAAEESYLSPGFDYFHLKKMDFPPRGPDTPPMTLLPYDEMLKTVSIQQQAKYSGLDLSQEQKALLEASYQNAYARSLSVLDYLYKKFSFQQLWKSPIVAWNHSTLYPDLKINEILPLESPLRTFLPLSFRKAMIDETEGYAYYNLHVLLIGNLIVEKDPRFKGWHVAVKGEGKEHGFILISPDGKRRLYAKYTSDIYQEYFVAKMLSHLSLKMAEPLLIFQGGVPLLLTRDLSREYQKKDQLKSKTFKTMGQMIKQASMYNSYSTNKKDSKEEVEQTQQFLKSFAEDPTIKASFAQILLAGLVFGLNDLGAHGGNIGLINTKILGKTNRQKMGIVDFSSNPIDLNEVVSAPLLKYLAEEIKRMAPIFQEMFKHLKEQDFLKALDKFKVPRARSYSQEGFLLLQNPVKQVNRKEIVEEIWQDFIKELSKELSASELKTILERVFQSKQMIESNFEFLFQELNPAQTQVQDPGLH